MDIKVADVASSIHQGVRDVAPVETLPQQNSMTAKTSVTEAVADRLSSQNVEQAMEISVDDPALAVEDLEALNQQLSYMGQSIYFSKDEQAGGRNVIALVDRDTDELIKQFPSKEALQVAYRIQEFLEVNQAANTPSGENRLAVPLGAMVNQFV